MKLVNLSLKTTTLTPNLREATYGYQCKFRQCHSGQDALGHVCVYLSFIGHAHWISINS